MSEKPGYADKAKPLGLEAAQDDLAPSETVERLDAIVVGDAMFRVGDVVKLKSGGLPMTIGMIRKWPNGHKLVRCFWMFDGKADWMEFTPEMLSNR